MAQLITNLREVKQIPINDTLTERGKRYGSFADHANITWRLKEVLHSHPKWTSLPFFIREALDMICHKIGRIMNGDSHYHDNWHDIAGYATLAEQVILEKEKT